MNAIKKAVTPPSPKIRIPKGLPGAGQYANPEIIRLLKDVQREINKRAAKDKKNAASRETRAKQRAARATRMAKVQQSVNTAKIQKKLKKWGSRSTSRLRANTRYHWHAIMVVSGGSEALGKISKFAKSENVKLRLLPADPTTPNADPNYEAIFTPYLGAFLPSETDQAEAIALSILAEMQATGVVVQYEGLFYNRERFDK